MSPEVIGIIGIIILLFLTYSRMWVGLAMLFVGFWGIAALLGWNVGLSVLATVPYRSVAQYPMTAMPLFILMGVVVANTGLGADLFKSAHKWIGQLRGGLASATVAACAGMAAMSGTGMAGMATMAKVALPEMKKHKYDDRLASGCIVAGSTIGDLIPPSMGFILYGILTETSIGPLFIAGIIPGVLLATFYMITIHILCRFNPMMGPPGPRTNLKEKVISLKDTWGMMLLFLLAVGGIYMGIFTPTEAGAVGAFGTIVLTLLARRLNWRIFLKSILETTQITAMMFLLIAGAFVFNTLIVLSKLGSFLGDFVVGLPFSPIIILIAIMIMYILLGIFLDVMSCILITVPIFFPIVVAMGFDPIWYGVLMVRVMEVGTITPPMGMGAFLFSGITDVPVGTVFRGIIPFTIADLFHIAILIAFPAMSLFLPSMMQ